MGVIFYILMTLLSLCSLALFILPILMFRNNATYNVRIRIINERYELYKYLPSYDDMYYSFSSLKYEYWVKYCEDRRFEDGYED